MSRIVAAVVAALLTCLLSGSALADQKLYQRDDLASDGVRLAAKWKSDYKTSGVDAAKTKAAAQAAEAKGDETTAYDDYAAALVLDPKDWKTWSRLAHLAAGMTGANYSETYKYHHTAIVAGYAAYLQAPTKPDEATALGTLAAVYEGLKEPKDALIVLRSAIKVAENKDNREAYNRLRADVGFRLLDYKLDADAVSPRVCFQFSEELAGGKVDFTPYVVVGGIATPAITNQGQQLCVEGLEHGKRYSVVLRQGLPSAVGEDLLKPADYDLYVKDRSPAVRFTGKNYVLPRTGQEGLPIITVNTPKVDVDVYRIGDRSLAPTVHSEDFFRQLDGYSADKIADEKGVKVWSGKLDVKSELNKDVITAFPVLQAVGKLEPGIYIMLAKATNGSLDQYDSRATQWFLVSDLGLTSFSGDDGLHVFVRSLASADPVAGVNVRLIAKNNEVLATAETDATGHVKFDAGLSRGKGGLSPGLVVADDGKGDYGFLDQQGQAFDLTDRGVKGRESPTGLDAFLYTERGVYRSGETVNVTSLLRDVKGKSVNGLPVTLVAERSDGVEYRRSVVADQGEGGRAWSLPLVSGAPTGTWHVKAFSDPKRPAIGEVSFLVEDYVPERIDMKLTPKQTRLNAGEPLEIGVLANYLYGAPAGGLALSGTLKVEQSEKSTIPGLEDWTIGIDDENFESISKEIEGEYTTDEKGAGSVVVEVPPAETTRPLQMTVNLKIAESGGREIERSLTVPILPKASVFAVKQLFADYSLNAGDQAKFDVVFATPDGQKLAKKGVKWQLSQITHSYQWYNSEGRWDFEVIKRAERVADGTLDIAATDPAHISAPVDWGNYRLDISSDDPAGPHTSVTFWVGWGSSDKVDTPDILDVATDKDAYQSGDEIKIRLKPRFAGKATVAIISDKVYDLRNVDVTPAGTTLSIPADGNWGAGAYVVAMAYRPLDVAAHRMPGRAIGVAWTAIDRPTRTLGVKLNTPELIRPRGALTIPVKIAGLEPGEAAFVTVSAVDLGILNLTHYETPNPEAFAFGQRLLSGEWRDLYGFLIDGMQGTRGTITQGGDQDTKKTQAPPDQEPLSRYSGVVTVGSDGTAAVNFDIPAFNGTVRVAAVAWTKAKLGHGEADVIVRDPVVVQATLPRFMALGDQSRFHLAVDNVEGPAGDYHVDVDIHGPVALPVDALSSTLKLPAKGRAQLSLPVTAAGLGKATVDVKLTGPNIEAGQTLALTVEPATPAIYHRSIQPLAQNGGSITLTDDLTKDFLAGTGVVSISVAPQTAFDVAALLKALDRYPYGCTEQTVSRALPLLYVNKLAEEQNLALDEGIDARIKTAIDRVLARQDSNGSFGLWGVGGDSIWLDAYVGDFLTRARERGYGVPDTAITSLLDRLRNYIVNTNEPKEADAYEIAYAAYVLARNGRPVIGDLRYLADTKPEIFVTPLAKAQIGAALAMLGDRGRAQPLFQAAVERLGAITGERTWREDYGSPLRDGAGLIALMAEANAQGNLVQKASALVETDRGAVTYTSTQENAWMVLAAYATMKDADKVSLTINGQPRDGAFYRSYKASTLEAGPVTVVNNGPIPVKAVINASGHPILPEPAQSAGYKIERTFHTLDGKEVDPSKVKQTTRLVVVLKVTEDKAAEAKIIVVDRLPAGFEIDNPDLVKSGSVEGFDWLVTTVEAAHTEYRDDRFVAAIDRGPSQSAFFNLAYMVRAVAPGKYVLPPATVEDMYRPERFGRTAFGTVEVTDK
ncbi:MAG: MG2 domain-containing protein [Ancalomicrobiaceae bacterium]|nr:MG2 domain-containing protein [Ancalomicrobiaceae bacterium]